MNELDGAFLLPTRVLDFTSARARALNQNLAHANVPGYRRVDVDFAALLAAVKDEREPGHTGALAGAHPTTAQDATAPVGADGGNVEFEREQIQIEKNALLHQLATLMVSGTLNQLRSAIRGEA